MFDTVNSSTSHNQIHSYKVVTSYDLLLVIDCQERAKTVYEMELNHQELTQNLN